MNLIKQFKPLVRIADALETIAVTLTYFATKDAQQSGRIFNPKPKHYATDQSALFHTADPATVNKLRQEEADIMSNRGFKYLDELESQDE